MTLASVMPMLASKNLDRTWEFYRQLGFEKTDQREFSFQVARKGVELYFSQTDTDYTLPEFASYSRACAVRVPNLMEWHDSFEKSGVDWDILYPSLTDPGSGGSWGAPAFAITDPDANLIWFVEAASN